MHFSHFAGCLIPCIKDNSICLYYIQLPFEDDIRGFTLENFNVNKKFTPSDEQLALMDSLIDSMDLTKKASIASTSHAENDDDENGEQVEEEETELYDPHTTINPYIQRMFQAIALRATNPAEDLPNFEKHITATHLSKIGEKVRSQATLGLLKRCGEVFTLKEHESKKSKTQDESMFDEKKKEASAANGDAIATNGEEDTPALQSMDDLLKSGQSKVKRVGTITPVNDFKLLAERIWANLALRKEEGWYN